MTVTISYLTISLGMNRHQHDQTAQQDGPVCLELLFDKLVFPFSGSWYYTPPGILSILRRGVVRRHHVLNVINHWITGGRHCGLKGYTHTEVSSSSSSKYIYGLLGHVVKVLFAKPQFSYPIIVLFVWILIKKKVVKGKGMRGIQDLVIK